MQQIRGVLFFKRELFVLLLLLLCREVSERVFLVMKR